MKNKVNKLSKYAVITCLLAQNILGSASVVLANETIESEGSNETIVSTYVEEVAPAVEAVEEVPAEVAPVEEVVEEPVEVIEDSEIEEPLEVQETKQETQIVEKESDNQREIVAKDEELIEDRIGTRSSEQFIVTNRDGSSVGFNDDDDAHMFVNSTDLFIEHTRTTWQGDRFYRLGGIGGPQIDSPNIILDPTEERVQAVTIHAWGTPGGFLEDAYDNGLALILFQRTSSEVNVAGVINNPAEIVKNPESVTVGRPSSDTYGDYTYSWEIKNAAGEVVASGTGNQPDQTMLDGLELGIYTVYNTVTESYPPEFQTASEKGVSATTSGKFEIVGTEATVKHYTLDEDGNPTLVQSEDPLSGKVGTSFTTSEIEIPGYELTIGPNNEGIPSGSGTFTEEDQVVNYYYKKKEINIDVQYVYEDEDGILHPITEMPSETLTGLYDTEYVTEAKQATGYELVRVDESQAPKEGNFGPEDATITYVYKKIQSKLTVNHKDVDGSPIDDPLAATTESTANFDEKYTTNPETIPGYIFVTVTPESDSESGSYGATNKEVTYLYEKAPSKVTVNYVDDETGLPIKNVSPEVIDGKFKDPYETNSKEIPGYELVVGKVDGEPSGNMAAEPTEVTYYYQKKDIPLIVHHIDKDGETLSPDVTDSGKFESPYETESAKIPGYVLTETPANPSGNYGPEKVVVTYVYEKIKTDVTTNFVDEEGNPIPGVPSVVVNGEYEDSYSTTPKDIPGYVLVPEKTNGDPVTGEHGEKDKVINYVYTKAPATINVHHEDKDGNKLVDSSTETGLYSEPYSTDPAEIPGYILVTTPGNAEGTYAVDPINVTYVYEKIKTDVTTNFVDEEGNPIPGVPSVVVNGEYEDAYTTTPKDIPGYVLVPEKTNGDPVTGEHGEEDKVINYVYQKVETVVTTHHVDKYGNVLATSTSETGLYQSPYDTDPTNIYGYQLVESLIPANAEGNFAEGPTQVTYVYELIAPTVNQSNEGATVVTGTGTPGMQVEVTFPNGSTVIVDVQPDGTWSAPVPVDVYLKVGELVTAVTIDPTFGTSSTKSAQGEGPVVAKPIDSDDPEQPVQPTDPTDPGKPADSPKNSPKPNEAKKDLPKTGEATVGQLFSLVGWMFVATFALMFKRRKESNFDN